MREQAGLPSGDAGDTGSVTDPEAVELAVTALTGHLLERAQRTDEAAALPSPAVVLSARLDRYYDRLRHPPPGVNRLGA
jgi:hypothetical protein